MPGPDDPLAPERVAALVAPVVDRLRNAARSSIARSGELARQFGVGDAAMVTMAMLRNALPVRAVTRQQVHAVLAYWPPERVDAGIAEAVAAGLLGEGDPMEATARGRDFVAGIYALGSEVVGQLWAGHEPRVESLLASPDARVDRGWRSEEATHG